jgi:GntR family transcriptional regulator / MocR family aminotransferase
MFRSPVWLTSVCHLSEERSEPLPTQLYHDLVRAVRDGRIGDGDRLPSSRRAAEDLGVSRTTVTSAYELLAAEGIITVRQGAAPRVISPEYLIQDQTCRHGPTPSLRGEALSTDFRREVLPTSGGALSPGEPDETLFPADEWARLLRRVSRRRLGAPALYGDPYGVEDLRLALRDRLASDRGVHVDADQIVIVPGSQAAMALLAQVLTDPGDLAAIEDPGWLGARAAFLGAGLRLSPLRVDAGGADPASLPVEARLAYLTPSNQYPLGKRLSLSRRLEFIARAKVTGAVLIEDDYDSDFHWSGRTIPALAAQDHDGHVVLIGSASKALLPALRIGWIVVPPGLIDTVRRAQRNLGMIANLHAQFALAELMQSGRYRVQIRRIARDYHGRVRTLVEALTAISEVTVHPPDGGVQVTLQFRSDLDEEPVLAELARRGLHPGRLSGYYQRGDLRGLVIGVGSATPERITMLRDGLRNLFDQDTKHV